MELRSICLFAVQVGSLNQQRLSRMKPHSAGLWLLSILNHDSNCRVLGFISPAAQRASQSWTSAGGESCIHLTSICWLWNMELSSPVHLWGTGWSAVQVAHSLRLSHPEWAGPCCSKGWRLDQAEKEGNSSKVPFITWDWERPTSHFWANNEEAPRRFWTLIGDRGWENGSRLETWKPGGWGRGQLHLHSEGYC